jgi:hypothetical protein
VHLRVQVLASQQADLKCWKNYHCGFILVEVRLYSRYSLYEYSYNELAKTSTRYMNICYMNIFVI